LNLGTDDSLDDGYDLAWVMTFSPGNGQLTLWNKPNDLTFQVVYSEAILVQLGVGSDTGTLCPCTDQGGGPPVNLLRWSGPPQLVRLADKVY